MAAIQDRDYLRLCAELASLLSISQASARRRVDQQAAQDGARDVESRKAVATSLLEAAKTQQLEGSASSNLDTLLEAEAKDEHFMLED
tara:strand:- start:913 stop:1176 length:264 start_codon:yes stop_codon:yes gene_type:complete